MVVTGQRVKIDGGGSGDARSETLDSQTVFTGQLVVGATDVLVKGLKFQNTAQRAITFTAPTANLVLEDCVFTADASQADSQWWFGGDGGYVSGNVTIRNCIVQGYKSWMLADLTTGSSIPTTKLDTVIVEKNLFKSGGAFAVRGIESDPNDLVVFRDNKVRVVDQHASFWDSFESNNMKRCIATGNDIELESVVGKVGGFQIWSKSALPWTLEYSGNTMKTMRVGLKYGASLAGFKAGNTADSRFKVDLNSTHTNVEYAFSPVYKHPSTASANKWTEGPWDPDNEATYTLPPVPYNPLGLAVVSPS